MSNLKLIYKMTENRKQLFVEQERLFWQSMTANSYYMVF